MRAFLLGARTAGAYALFLLGISTSASANVFVSNTNGDSVSVINSATNLVIATIPVGSEPRNSAMTPNGQRVYVPNRFDDNVSVISTASNTVIATVNDPGFDEPYAVAFTPNGAEAWVANKIDSTGTGSVSIIATGSNTVIATINDVCFNSPESIAINPVLARAYVINRGDGIICVVNTVTRTVIGSVNVGGEPRFAVLTPSGGALFVSRAAGDSVARINTATNTFITIATGGTPRNMAVSVDGSKVYVATQSGTVSVIAVATNAVTTLTLTGASSTYGVAVASATLGYVTDEGNSQVYVFNPATDTEIGLPIADPGFNGVRAISATAVAAAPLGATTIPTLSQWGLVAMALLLMGFALVQMRRRQRPAPRRTR